MSIKAWVLEILALLGFNHPPSPSPHPHSPLLPRQQVCNGASAFCSRQYSNVSLIGAHDSAFVGSIIDPRVNQEQPVAEQLDAGIRFLQAQTHVKGSGSSAMLAMCHTSRLELDAGSLEAYLSTVKGWLDVRPNEVVMMLLVNGDNIDGSMFDTGFSNWPTYCELIADGKRLLMFLDAKADETKVPYILDEFTSFFATPYDTTDPNFAECTFNHPAGGSPDGRMYIINHFLDLDILSIDIQDDVADGTTNAATGGGSIGAQAQLGEQMYGRPLNFVLVDMFDRGNVFAAQNALNGV
ncbi:hypothetical protein LTR62_001995 [Meristemomyces frigidus]|uniref:PLC-like phosphodiesterase n=1 Tax=Meristemomyces frigidus TaxID=1508187 RepID=A0AAN7YHW4_9PEZI|nr:hypothetical protein LTR62_001995 [Meristemomyces frigidus]